VSLSETLRATPSGLLRLSPGDRLYIVGQWNEKMLLSDAWTGHVMSRDEAEGCSASRPMKQSTTWSLPRQLGEREEVG
jgi:hypothetical protein